MNDFYLYSMVMGSVGLVALAGFPALEALGERLTGAMQGYQQGKVAKATKALDDIFVEVKPTWLKVSYGLGPLIMGFGVFVLTQRMLFALLGAVLGVVLPDLWVRQTQAIRKRRFQAQLVDALFILSSSLKAGLSLTQAFEVLEQEMPPPASQEFGLVIKAHRLGRSFEEALQGLNERMACEELNLITTAILIARETGGDVTAILGQLIMTIRERKKLNDKVMTLTLQGRLQAYIMSVLPVLFAAFVRAFNPRYFDAFLGDPTGMALLAVAGALWAIGMVSLLKLSKVDV